MIGKELLATVEIGFYERPSESCHYGLSDEVLVRQHLPRSLS